MDDKLENDSESAGLPLFSVGELLVSFYEFKKIFDRELKKSLKFFPSIPVKIVIKRMSNNMVVDLLGITRIEMDKKRTGVWLICHVNRSDSVFIHERSIVKLKLTTKTVKDITDRVDHFKKNFIINSSNNFYDFPVRICIMHNQNQANEEIVDMLNVEAILMDDVGTGVFIHSMIEDSKMIKNNPKLKELLDQSEKKYFQLFSKLNNRAK